VILGISAAVLSTVAAVGGGDHFAAWLPVITTVGAAFAAEAAFQRHDTLAVEYARTIRQLERLLAGRDDRRAAGAAPDDEFVAACERVIGTQNDAWMSQTLRAGEGS
jgi:SMODS and SLOG-associating 2TM effector domain 1